MTWGGILERWKIIELDLHQIYGIDVGDKALLRSRSWRWLSLRILGLMNTECRTQRVFNPEKPQKK